MEPNNYPSSRPRESRPRAHSRKHLSALRCQQVLDDAPTLSERAKRLFAFSKEVSSKSDNLAFQSLQQKGATRDFLIGEIGRWGENMVVSPPDLDIEDLFHIVGSYRHLRVRPTVAMEKILLDQSRDKLTQMRAFHLRKMPSIFADLAIYPGDEWMEAWRLEAQKKSGEWDLPHGYHLIYKMAVMDHLRAQDDRYAGPSPCRAMVSPMMDFVASKAHYLFNGTIESQIHLAGLWFDYDFVKERRPEAESTTVSRAEVRLSESFAHAGIPSGDMIEIPSMGHKVDLSLVFNDSAIGCEFDGTYHFVEMPDEGHIHYDGSTRLQTALITRHMPPEMRLVRVPSFVADKIVPTRAWRDVMRRVAQQNPGAYVMHAIDDIRPAAVLDAWNFSRAVK